MGLRHCEILLFLRKSNTYLALLMADLSLEMHCPGSIRLVSSCLCQKVSRLRRREYSRIPEHLSKVAAATKPPQKMACTIGKSYLIFFDIFQTCQTKILLLVHRFLKHLSPLFEPQGASLIGNAHCQG